MLWKTNGASYPSDERMGLFTSFLNANKIVPDGVSSLIRAPKEDVFICDAAPSMPLCSVRQIADDGYQSSFDTKEYVNLFQSQGVTGDIDKPGCFWGAIDGQFPKRNHRGYTIKDLEASIPEKHREWVMDRFNAAGVNDYWDIAALEDRYHILANKQVLRMSDYKTFRIPDAFHVYGLMPVLDDKMNTGANYIGVLVYDSGSLYVQVGKLMFGEVIIQASRVPWPRNHAYVALRYWMASCSPITPQQLFLYQKIHSDSMSSGDGPSTLVIPGIYRGLAIQYQRIAAVKCAASIAHEYVIALLDDDRLLIMGNTQYLYCEFREKGVIPGIAADEHGWLPVIDHKDGKVTAYRAYADGVDIPQLPGEWVQYA
jgi:hypothetical protein